MINKITFWIAIMHLSSVGLMSQDHPSSGKADTAALKLADYIVKNLQEKVYLVTDKPYYALGDTLWFQSYLVNAVLHEPLTLSNTIYVDLIGPDGIILDSLILLSDQGLAPGDFLIGEDWSPGRYMLRAYTKWMLNFPEDYLFRKEIEIVNIWPQDYKAEDAAADIDSEEIHPAMRFEQPRIDIRFFPEGGNLVPGFPALIGVKAKVADKGQGVKVKGRILNSVSGVLVAQFECNEYGIGAFYLPQVEETYKVALDSPSMDFQYEFPDVNNGSYGLKVINRYQAKTIHVMMETDIPGGLEGGFLIGHTRGELFVAIGLNGVNALPRKMVSLNPAIIPTGVAHFTFFDKDGVPQAERLAFVDRGDEVYTADLTAGKKKFSKREKVELSIRLADTVDGNVSLSVTNSSVVKRDDHSENLASYLLLTSDLSGYVADPAYYFTGRSKEKHEQLDHLMLTHGWRRFRWEDIFKAAQPSIQPEAGITFSGRLKNFTFRKKTEKGVVQLIGMPQGEHSFTSGFFFDMAETDENGRFLFRDIHYWDSVKFIIQAKKSGEALKNRFYIELDEWEGPSVPAFHGQGRISEELRNLFIGKSNQQFVIEKSYGQDVIMLDEIAIERRREDPFQEAVGGRYGNPGYRLVADSLYNNPAFLIDILRQVPFIQFSATGSPIIRSVTPTVFLDGFELEGNVVNDIIQGTPGHEIYFVDVDRTGLSTSRGNPVIYIYTKSGNGIQLSSEAFETPGVLQVYHPGYYRAREFYAPAYAPGKPKVVKPDYRLQLFWKPQVRIEDGWGSASFYVGDDPQTFDIVVEGMTSNGEVIQSKRQFHVE